ncbi:MAG: hypothetical protein JWM41_879 [Gemmatimonadetes bacterium]|nr:hypothetical protein [Gemmatimonadota bacterium]
MSYFGPYSDLYESERNELRGLLRPSAVRTKAEYIRLAQLSERLAAHESESSDKWSDRQAAELHALLTEYKSLRQESMNTITHRTQVMMLGLAAVGALAGGAMTSVGISQRPVFVTAVFSGAIPLFAAFVFLAWLSEAVRSHRAGYFLASWLEPRVNALLGKLTLSFEASLWTRLLPRDELWGPSMMALGIMGLIALMSPLLGLVMSNSPFGLWGGNPIAAVWVPWLGLACVGAYAVTQMKRLRNEDQLIAAVISKDRAEGSSHRVPKSVSRPEQPNER